MVYSRQGQPLLSLRDSTKTSIDCPVHVPSVPWRQTHKLTSCAWQEPRHLSDMCTPDSSGPPDQCLGLLTTCLICSRGMLFPHSEVWKSLSDSHCCNALSQQSSSSLEINRVPRHEEKWLLCILSPCLFAVLLGLGLFPSPCSLVRRCSWVSSGGRRGHTSPPSYLDALPGRLNPPGLKQGMDLERKG